MYITPLRWSGGGNKKKFSLLPKEGPRLPPLAALGWIIAYYVEFGKILGDGLPRRCAPRNDGTGDAGPLRPLRGHLPQGGRQGSLGFSGLVLDPPVGELAAELTERAGYGLPRRWAPRNDRTGD